MVVAVVHLSHGYPLGVGMPRVWYAVADFSNIGLQKLSIQGLISAIGSHLGCLADGPMIARQRVETKNPQK